MRTQLTIRLARRLKAALAAGFVLASNAVCHAQGCALCYTQAAGAGQRFIAGLRTGILVLIVPPMFMSAGITWLAYKKRNRTNTPSDSKRSDHDW
jgi:hypothetical protein